MVKVNHRLQSKVVGPTRIAGSVLGKLCLAERRDAVNGLFLYHAFGDLRLGVSEEWLLCVPLSAAPISVVSLVVPGRKLCLSVAHCLPRLLCSSSSSVLCLFIEKIFGCFFQINLIVIFISLKGNVKNVLFASLKFKFVFFVSFVSMFSVCFSYVHGF